MRVEGKDNRRPGQRASPSHQPIDQARVAEVNAVEIADCQGASAQLVGEGDQVA
jgi:hypothetical protein